MYLGLLNSSCFPVKFRQFRWSREISCQLSRGKSRVVHVYNQNLIFRFDNIDFTWFCFCSKKKCNDGSLENWYVTRRESMASSLVDTNWKMLSTSSLIWLSIIRVLQRKLKMKQNIYFLWKNIFELNQRRISSKSFANTTRVSFAWN